MVPAQCQTETYSAQFVPAYILISGNPSEIFFILVHTTPDLTHMELVPFVFPCHIYSISDHFKTGKPE